MRVFHFAFIVHFVPLKEGLVDIGKSFSYMFEDKDWIAKIAIGGGILLVGVILSPLIIPPIVAAMILLGYSLTVLKNVYEGSTEPLPAWSNIGELFMKGLYAFAGVLIWALPVIILACCLGLVNFGIASAANSGGSDTVPGVLGLFAVCLYCLLFIVAIAISLFVYAPLTNFAINGQINSFWDFQGAWRFIRMNASNYIIAFLLTAVAGFIAGFGVIACFIGVFFTNFWAMLVMAHLFGQVARANMTPTDTIIPPSPPMNPPTIDQPYEPAPAA